MRRPLGQLWRWSEVAAWANERLGTSFDPDEADLLAAINAMLEIRRLVMRLPEQERRALSTLTVAG